ncbi:MAG: MerR family transcriptional regulator [Ktedonobacteraceae bacterium]
MNLTIQEVAERTGISAYTIRYYEKSGVLPRVERSESGIRRFSEADVASLRYITDFKKAGLSLGEISIFVAEITRHGCIIDQFERGEATEQSVIKRFNLLCEHRQRLIEQRENLDRMLATVNQKIDRYERHFTKSPFQDLASGQQAAREPEKV